MYIARPSPPILLVTLDPSTLRSRNLKKHQFLFVFEENSIREIAWLSSIHRFRKASFLRRVSVHSLRGRRRRGEKGKKPARENISSQNSRGRFDPFPPFLRKSLPFFHLACHAG